MEGEPEKMLPYPLDYYKSVRHELGKSFTSDSDLLPIQLIQLEEEAESSSKLIKIAAEHEHIFMLNKKGGIIVGDEPLNLKINSPQLIFVMGNFVQHSLIGSYQRKVLNFFPLPQNTNDSVHHVFKKPIILKTLPGSVFHINLVDESFIPIKADVGVSTLAVLKKSFDENMFPVTLISSDAENLKLFPENNSNSFKNKLSFPLLINKNDAWGVTLRSIAYPKVKNIFSSFCFLRVKQNGGMESVTVSLDNAYVSSGTKFTYLMNSKIQEALSSFSGATLPRFFQEGVKVGLETNDFECHLNGDFLKILGLTHSYQHDGVLYHPQTRTVAVLEMNLFLLQPQEMIVICNIVEEAFYAQSRPKILKIVPVTSNQYDYNAYNYIQFDDEDTIPLKVDRIDDIEIKILSRKGDLIEFIDQQDVICQLEFKQLS